VSDDPKHTARRPQRFEPHRTARHDDAAAFVPDPDERGVARSDDDLAEDLAEEFVEAATTGEDRDQEALDASVPEEIGGPFVETSAADELAAGTDESNPIDAEAEPFPRAVGGIVAAPDEAQDNGDDEENP
jgi:hypothetical protein